MRQILLLFLFSIIRVNFIAAQEVAFIIAEKDLIPEGIAHDPVQNKLYVSSTYKRKIVEIDMATGKSRDFIWEAQDDIPGVIGLRVDAKRRHLWACAATAGERMPVRGLETATDKTGLYQYDLNTGKLLKKYTLDPDSAFHFINDVAISSNGTAYVTDTGAGKIFTADTNGKLKLCYAFNGYNPNGIDFADNGDLVVAVYGNPHAFIRLDLNTKAWSLITLPAGEQAGGDGFYFYKNSLIAIQPFNPQRIVAQYKLKDNTVVSDVNTLVDPNHASLFQPTTGVVIGDEFYFIANSQLQHFRKLFSDGMGKYRMEELQDVVILKAKL